MTLTRTRHKMPDYIRDALDERNLMDAYHARPEYQQNDYIGWITHAKREETKQKRLSQMLEELEGGRLYMKMRWRESHTLQRRRSTAETKKWTAKNPILARGWIFL